MTILKISGDGIEDNAITNAHLHSSAEIAGSKIADVAITNAKINSSAAIAGSKISPDFGSQNIFTTGSVGIGNSSPQRLLQVGAYGSSNGEIALASATTGYGSILFGDSASGTDLYKGYLQYNHQHDRMLSLIHI